MRKRSTWRAPLRTSSGKPKTKKETVKKEIELYRQITELTARIDKMKKYIKELKLYTDHLPSCEMVELIEAGRIPRETDCNCELEKVKKRRV